MNATDYIGRFISYNCKNVKTSVAEIKKLCERADIVCLQETWLLPYEMTILSEIHPDFDYTGSSAVDLSAGVLRGRPHGGVAILWRRSLFSNVSIIQSESNRIAAIKVSTSGSDFVVCSVYMPTDCTENFPVFTKCLGLLNAIVESGEVESVYLLGDFNAHYPETFGKEMLSFCLEQKWICADYEYLNIDSDNFTFISEAHNCKRWLDHCLVTSSAWNTITKVHIDYGVYSSDHFPLFIECNLNVIRPKLRLAKHVDNKVLWGSRDVNQIEKYRELCNKQLRDIDFPTVPTIYVIVMNIKKY